MLPQVLLAASLHAVKLQPVLYGIFVNGVDQAVVLVLGEDEQHRIYMAGDDLEDINFDLAQYRGATISFQGQSYYQLNGFPGIKYSIDSKAMVLNIAATGESFRPNDLHLHDQTPTPTISTGAYLNYNFNSTSSFTDEPANNTLYLNANAFGPYGIAYNSMTAQSTEGQSGVVRLLTAWQYILPEKMTNWVVGDAFSSTTQWNQSAGFGGVQYSSNFDAQPNFVTSPLPSTSGVATLPSTVQIFVNNNLVNTQSVNPGPFKLNDIPVINGDGTVSIITTNILGQQQVETIPYSTSNQLLKPGLSSYSYEAGFLRENFSVASNDYGPFMLSATRNQGITNYFTLQAHAEGTTEIQALGVGGNLLLGRWGMLNGSVAPSLNSARQLGSLALLGYSSSGGYVSYGANAQMTTPHFTDIGYASGGSAPAFQTQAFFALPLMKKQGTISCSYTLQHNRDGGANVSLVNLSYSRMLLKNWFLTASAVRSLRGSANSMYMFSLNKLLGNNTVVSASGSMNSQGSQEMVSAGNQLDEGPGFAYNVQVSNANTEGSDSAQTYQGTLYAQNNVGTYSVGAARASDQNVYQFQGAGALVFADKHLLMSRSINSSFALVEVGYPNVQVYSNHRLYGKTNQAGNLILPNLNPYLRNIIGIEADDLPLTATMRTTEIEVTPYEGAGVIAHFDVGSLMGGTMIVRLPSGEVVPEGAVATGQDQTIYPIGQDGILYLSGLVIGANPISVSYGEESCGFNIDFRQEMIPDPINNPVPDLGSYVCTPVKQTHSEVSTTNH